MSSSSNKIKTGSYTVTVLVTDDSETEITPNAGAIGIYTFEANRSYQIKITSVGSVESSYCKVVIGGNARVGKYASEKMREKAGYVDGTQISRITSNKQIASNTSGARGVYWDKNSEKWRARLCFKGEIYNFGTYANFEDSVKARKEAEQQIFGEFLEQLGS